MDRTPAGRSGVSLKDSLPSLLTPPTQNGGVGLWTGRQPRRGHSGSEPRSRQRRSQTDASEQRITFLARELPRAGQRSTLAREGALHSTVVDDDMNAAGKKEAPPDLASEKPAAADSRVEELNVYGGRHSSQKYYLLCVGACDRRWMAAEAPTALIVRFCPFMRMTWSALSASSFRLPTESRNSLQTTNRSVNVAYYRVLLVR